MLQMVGKWITSPSSGSIQLLNLPTDFSWSVKPKVEKVKKLHICIYTSHFILFQAVLPPLLMSVCILKLLIWNKYGNLINTPYSQDTLHVFYWVFYMCVYIYTHNFKKPLVAWLVVLWIGEKIFPGCSTQSTDQLECRKCQTGDEPVD